MGGRPSMTLMMEAAAAGVMSVKGASRRWSAPGPRHCSGLVARYPEMDRSAGTDARVGSAAAWKTPGT